MKDSYRIELAVYAKNNIIDDQPAFASWVPYTFLKRDDIIKKVKSKYWQKTHKCGARIPKSIEEAFKIEEENGNYLWRVEINKEMKKIIDLNTFKKYDEEPDALVGYQEITVNIVFDIKLSENFKRQD